MIKNNLIKLGIFDTINLTIIDDKIQVLNFT